MSKGKIARLCLAFMTIALPARALELSHNASQISGADARTGVSFQSTLASPSHVSADLFVGAKQIHAEIDYASDSLGVWSLTKANGAPAALAPQDIAAVQQLRFFLPARIGATELHADALASLVNLVASAPAGVTIKIATVSLSYTSICPLIGSSDIASYRLPSGMQRASVTVGPACYVAPALGRCGAAGGPDPGIGLAQRFTQQCLDHDQCCVATGDRYVDGADVCGKAGTDECIPEFIQAAPGFFFAPDCGVTTGTWTDDAGAVWSLTGGGPGIGENPAISGTVTPPGCAPYSVSGLRNGVSLYLFAANGAKDGCAAWVEVKASFSNCNAASGTSLNSNGQSAAWSWTESRRRMTPASLAQRAASPWSGGN